MNIRILEMSLEDYDEVHDLWLSTPGYGVNRIRYKGGNRPIPSKEPRFEFYCQGWNKLIGAALCGHDGRRGYLHHVAIAPSIQAARNWKASG